MFQNEKKNPRIRTPLQATRQHGSFFESKRRFFSRALAQFQTQFKLIIDLDESFTNLNVLDNIVPTLKS